MEAQLIGKTVQSDKPASASLLRGQAPESPAAHPLRLLRSSLGNRTFGQFLQTKLKIGPAGDHFEQEADHVAERVMRISPIPPKQLEGADKPQLRRLCKDCEEEEETLHRSAKDESQTSAPLPDETLLRSGGEPMPPPVRDFYEERFAREFGAVRLHTGPVSESFSESLHAHAFTYGNHIWLGRGQEVTPSPLLAHELAHVVQQGQAGKLPVVQRQEIDQPLPGPSESLDDPRDPETTSAPKGKAWKGASSRCGPSFCSPLPTQRFAEHQRDSLWTAFAAGIAFAVSPRVVPLWTTWAFGGSSVQNLTKDFGSDFANSPTTLKTTRFLLNEIRNKLTSSPPVFPAVGPAKLDIRALIPAAVRAIDDPDSPDQMNFNLPSDIPGNLAGGIGKDEKANPVGATPSPQDDERITKGEVSVVDAGSHFLVTPDLRYTVKDTVDLCPGDCGEKKEQIATIPMSQWEATGISGDVPFTVIFLRRLRLSLFRSLALPVFSPKKPPPP